MATTSEIHPQLRRLGKDCARLEAHRLLSLDEFLADSAIQNETCYLLFTTYQGARDIAASLLAILGLPKPNDNANVFALLGEEDVLSQICVSQLTAMQGLCTSLSQDFDDIDPQWVYQALQTNVDGLNQFAHQVETHLEQ